MGGYLKYIGLAVLALMIIPIGTIYRQNIEVWAESKGFDQIISSGGRMLSENPQSIWALILFFFFLGGTAFLWLEHFVRIKFPKKMNYKTEKVIGQEFRHEEVVIDGKSFEDCKFDGAKLVYKGTGYFHFVGCSFTDFSIQVENEPAYVGLNLMRLTKDSGKEIRFESEKRRAPQGTE